MAEIPEVIQAKAFQLVDDSGNVTAEWKTHSVLGTPAFGLRDKNGDIRLMMLLNEYDQPVLVLNNKNKEYRYLLTLDENDLPYFLLTDGRMETSVTATGYERLPYRPPRPLDQQGSSKSWWRRFLTGEGC